MNQLMGNKIGVWEKREQEGCRSLSCGWRSQRWLPWTHPARSGAAWSSPGLDPERGSRRPAGGAGSATGRRPAVRPPRPRSPTPPPPPPAGTRRRLRERRTEGGLEPSPGARGSLPPSLSLTVHRLRLRVAVGEPGPQAEARSVGVGPDVGVGERQRRPAGGAVEAGHGACAGSERGRRRRAGGGQISRERPGGGGRPRGLPGKRELGTAAGGGTRGGEG